MGKIAVHEFISLDGVYEDPRWTMEYGFDPKMGETLAAIMSNCSGILLGRRTYEMFYPAWSTRTADDDPGAPFFNDTPKHVVSATVREPTWRSTEILGPYDAGAIRELKERTDGGLYVSGSGTLVRSLLADGLVDELHLFVYPVLAGAGPRLFEGPAPLDLSLASSAQYENGVLYLVYATGS